MNPLSAFTPAGKAVLLLSIALAGSLFANAKLLQAQWVAHGKAIVQKDLDKANGKLAGYERTEAVNKAVAAIKQEDHVTLLADLTAIAERGQRFEVRWRNATTKQPLGAGCAPGQARMDAVNALLSGQETPREPDRP